MKVIPIYLLLCVCPLFAQTTVSEVLSQGMKRVAAEKSSISQEDQKALVDSTATLLIKHITFRADGTASSYYTNKGRISVEWKKFMVVDIRSQTITEADRLNGISKKHSVIFGCDAHRAWDSKTNRWGEWEAQGFSDFPLGIVFVYKNAVWSAEAPPLLKYFSPGSGTSIADTAPKPAGKTNALPPGMQKTK
jgi:hypothetical protein